MSHVCLKYVNQDTSTPKETAKRPIESRNNPGLLISVGCVAVSFFFTRVGNFGKETPLTTENLFVESVREGVTRRKLADVLCELGF